MTDPQILITLASSGLRLGMQAYEAAKRLSADGYEVPGLDEFEAKTDELRTLPDLAAEDGDEA